MITNNLAKIFKILLKKQLQLTPKFAKVFNTWKPKETPRFKRKMCDQVKLEIYL